MWIQVWNQFLGEKVDLSRRGPDATGSVEVQTRPKPRCCKRGLGPPCQPSEVRKPLSILTAWDTPSTCPCEGPRNSLPLFSTIP